MVLSWLAKHTCRLQSCWWSTEASRRDRPACAASCSLLRSFMAATRKAATQSQGVTAFLRSWLAFAMLLVTWDMRGMWLARHLWEGAAWAVLHCLLACMHADGCLRRTTH